MPSLGTPAIDTVGMQFPLKEPRGIRFPAHLKMLFGEKLFPSRLSIMSQKILGRGLKIGYTLQETKNMKVNKGMGENKDIFLLIQTDGQEQSSEQSELCTGA